MVRTGPLAKLGTSLPRPWLLLTNANQKPWALQLLVGNNRTHRKCTRNCRTSAVYLFRVPETDVLTSITRARANLPGRHNPPAVRTVFTHRAADGGYFNYDVVALIFN